MQIDPKEMEDNGAGGGSTSRTKARPSSVNNKGISARFHF